MMPLIMVSVFILTWWAETVKQLLSTASLLLMPLSLQPIWLRNRELPILLVARIVTSCQTNE